MNEPGDRLEIDAPLVYVSLWLGALLCAGFLIEDEDLAGLELATWYFAHVPPMAKA